MAAHRPAGTPVPTPPAREGLRGPGLRRDLSDLNLMFLQRAADPGMRSDPRFALPTIVSDSLLRCGPEMLTRAAACPFALFGFSLPADQDPRGVADVETPSAAEPVFTAASERVLSFTHPLIGLVNRLAFVAPLALRLAFGLPAGAEAALFRLLPSEQAWLARWVGLVRPRWPHSPRFWETLLSAASVDCPQALQRAHCLGMCLPDAVAAANGEPASRRPRR